MPILYFIACFGFLVQLVADRLLLCYYYREPPMYDTKLTQMTLRIINLMALVSVYGSWYQLGNYKIFES